MNPRLLTVLLVTIGSIVGGALGAKLHPVVGFVCGTIGAVFGWAAARAIWRKLF